MTRPQIKLYWKYLKKLQFKELENQAIVLWGYNPKKAKQDQRKRQMAEKWQEDPLYNFPNDIEYFSMQEAEQKIAVSRRFGEKIKEESRWDKKRGEACIGRYGVVARRCSMNDKLWGIWKESKQKGINLTLADIKRMILIDIKRSQLYPPGWTDDTASPPDWFLEKLRGEGRLDGILKQIDEATRS